MIKPLLVSVCISLLLTNACVSSQTSVRNTQGWSNLFNGHDLTGWTCEGNPDAWGVKNGEIVSVLPGEGWWLRTDRMYRDFELTLDFWMPEEGNSGIGLRGSSNGDPAFTGFEIQILDTHNQQPGLRNCGAVYEAIPPESMAVNKPGNWNTYRIKLIDSTLNVWLNGTQIHTDTPLDDRGFYRTTDNPLPLNARATTGYIAIQDHGHPFRFRNIKIRDLSPDPEPEGMAHLINTNLGTNWFAEDDAVWTIEQGTLVGRGGPGHLFTKDTFKDFELRSLVRVNTKGNSGMYFRVTPNPDPNNPWPKGYEAQIDQHDPKNYTGCIYNLAWPDSGPARSGPITRDNAWFDYRVRVVGSTVRTWINGVAVVNTKLDEFDVGHLAVQGHHVGNVIEFRDYRVISLD